MTRHEKGAATWSGVLAAAGRLDAETRADQDASYMPTIIIEPGPEDHGQPEGLLRRPSGGSWRFASTRAMPRDDAERERLRALVGGAHWARMGTGAESEASKLENGVDVSRSTIPLPGA